MHNEFVDAITVRARAISEPDVEARLSALLGPLRRAVLNRTRAAEGLPDLPEPQIELLRLLVATGGLTPTRAASELRMAPSTISNLVKTMAEAGLVDRKPLPSDRRGAMLVASLRARHLLDRYDQASAAMLREALDALPASDRMAIDSALPALQRLLTILASGPDAE